MASAHGMHDHIISVQPEANGLSHVQPDYGWAVPLIKAMERGDWACFKIQLDIDSSVKSRRINSRGDTFLHLATDTGNVHFVRELVKEMSQEEIELKNQMEDHALISAATGGIKEIAEIMLQKNSNLAGIPSGYGLLPIIIAVRNGNKDIAEYLYSKTPLEQLDPDKMENGTHIVTAGVNGARLVIAAIISDMYMQIIMLCFSCIGIALKLVKQYPKLAIACDNRRRNAAIILAERPSAFPSGCRHQFFEGLVYKGVSLLSGTEYIQRQMDGGSYGNKSQLSTMSQVMNGLRRSIWKGIEHISVPGLHIKQMHEKQLLHVQALELLKVISTQYSLLDESKLYEARGYRAILQASEFGVIDIVRELIKCNPELQFSMDGESRDIFHIAIVHRREKVFSLIYEMKNKKMISVRADTHNNTLLHAAGCKAPPSQRDRISGAALQMQSELQWFKEVERLVPPRFKEEKNKNYKTARELFAENHEKMVKEGEEWMKATANSCMVVATLIAAVMFTAAFTVPGGNDGHTGIPVLIRTKALIIFIVADALLLFSSLTSLLMFLAILTSRYAEQDFLLSLPMKLIIGLATLFFSVVFMLAAFCATLVIILEHRVLGVAIVSTVIATLPVALFIQLQFPLLVDMISPTLALSIFGTKHKRGIHVCSYL